MKHAALFSAALEQTIVWGHAKGLVDLDALAIDSVRIRAHASPAAVRTLARSTKRLEELLNVDTAKLDEPKRALHNAKLKKHRDTISTCSERGVTSFVTTNEAAALIPVGGECSSPSCDGDRSWQLCPLHYRRATGRCSD